MSPFPLPDNSPPLEGNCTITFTFPDDEQYVHIFMGHLRELTEREAYDYSFTGKDSEVAETFQGIIDGAEFECL